MPAGEDGVRVHIAADTDIVTARQEGRALASKAGFAATDQTLVATAISELARNIVIHAGAGDIDVHLVERAGRRGIRIAATDAGPGIHDIDRALEDGWSTGDGLGLGLPGARRLMDEFTIDSVPGRGTTVVLYKWSRRDG